MNGTLSQLRLQELDVLASKTRQLILETVHHANAGHIGGPLSVTDILVSLYFEMMNINPKDHLGSDRDRFVLSKGHSAIALYTVLALRGYFPVEELQTFDEIDSRLQAHPDMNLLPGLDMSTGSLGQGISAAVGMALGAKLQGKSFYTYCVIGDGESQEGQVWEAADVATKYGLDNLVVVMDYNKLQQYGWKSSEGNLREAPVQDPARKWEAFGWHVIEADGHSIEQLLNSFSDAKGVKEKPVVIIAHTFKGRGVSFMENNYVWHAKVPNAEELKNALQELQGGSR
ncbi:transketolase [Paenibacillus alginolyticus]|uniref:transketolase n=1 Tax=Paenibacillus alginolyticus TaxID=59839 RepID=UPI0003FD793A|nr:transketolase [Paenibacillus alginolyticus]MCY9665788.1 transketolase [Paenibacillus alginolyticus]